MVPLLSQSPLPPSAAADRAALAAGSEGLAKRPTKHVHGASRRRVAEDASSTRPEEEAEEAEAEDPFETTLDSNASPEIECRLRVVRDSKWLATSDGAARRRRGVVGVRAVSHARQAQRARGGGARRAGGSGDVRRDAGRNRVRDAALRRARRGARPVAERVRRRAREPGTTVRDASGARTIKMRKRLRFTARS